MNFTSYLMIGFFFLSIILTAVLSFFYALTIDDGVKNEQVSPKSSSQIAQYSSQERVIAQYLDEKQAINQAFLHAQTQLLKTNRKQ